MITIRVTDTETTGLDHAVHRICEIATVDLIIPGPDEEYFRPKRGRMWSSLINPERDIPPDASGVHDITDEMVQDAPKIADVLHHIKHLDDGVSIPDFFCAHNSRFDQKFINPIASVPWLDTYRIALALWRTAPSHKNNVLRYWLRLKLDPKVVEAEGARMRSHAALFDAYVTAAILSRIIFEGEMDLKEMVEVSSRAAYLPYYTFGEHAMKPIEEVPNSYLDWILKKFELTQEDERHTAFTELQRRHQQGV